MAQLTPLPLTVSCFSKIRIALPFWYRFTRRVPEKWPLKGCVCVCVVKKRKKWPVKTELWGAGVVVCLEQGADLHMALLMTLPLTVSCFSKIQIGFTFLVPAHLGSPGKKGH